MIMNKKSLIISLSVLLVLVLVCLIIYGNGKVEQGRDDIHVIFVPGLWTDENASEMYEAGLKEALPECQITVRKWQSNRLSWERAKLEADLLAGELAKEIFAMTDAERANLVLIGHSIGARVVVKAMADLNGFGMNIRRGVFLGAALPDDDESIPKALQASRCPCINISNRKDWVLSVIYSSIVGDYEECALGAYGSRAKYSEMSLIDVKIREQDDSSKTEEENVWDVLKKAIQKNIGNYQRHYVNLYFDELRATLDNDGLAKVLYPMMLPRRFTRMCNIWKTVSKSFGWEVRRHLLSRQLCIVNPSGVMVAVGDSEKIWRQFAKLKEQLMHADFCNNLKIDVMQDNVIDVEKVLPIDAIWETKETFDGWQLQKIKIGSTFRIVDPRDFIRASGREEKMRESFENIREQLTNGLLM